MFMANQISVNFEKTIGQIKPLHGVCCAPYFVNFGPDQQYIERFFKEGNIPFCRLHDCCGVYGGAYYVDVPNVFPNFDADENDSANYDFHYTDEYIGAIQEAGCESYYRLGVTIEWGSKKYTTIPPKDFAKWARICEHIIMHYNEGWADGFYYNLKYWEIWNEPENPGNHLGNCQWGGTKEEFYELYRVSSKYLKMRFPNLKIGGYGSCGFYAVTNPSMKQKYHDFVSFFTDFLVFVKENECPLDFFSWHIYTGDEKVLLAHAKYVRETLDAYGFTHTENHLNEWNIHAEGDGFAGKHTLEGASFNAVTFCMLQNTHYVDMAHYYCFSLRGMYNGLLNQNDLSVDPAWYPFVAFGNLYRLGNAVQISCDSTEVYASAAVNEEEYGILVANYNGDVEEVSIQLNGLTGEKMAQILFLDETHNLDEISSIAVAKDSCIQIKLPKQTVAYIKMV